MMKGFLVLTISVLIIAGCGLASEDVTEQENQVAEFVAPDCVLGELYSLPELSFDLCSNEVVSIGEIEDNLTSVQYNNIEAMQIIEGNYNDDRLIISYDELRESLAAGFFTGIESNSDNTLSLNYVDIVGFNVLKVEYNGSNQGFVDYFVLVEDNVLKFDDNFEALSVLTGVIFR